MFSADKIISYQLVGAEFDRVQKELKEFYKLPIEYGNPFDNELIKRGLKPEVRHLDVSYATFSKNVLNEHNMVNLTEVILKYAPGKNFYVYESWATDMKAGTVAGLHNHCVPSRDVSFSGVYYHDVDPSDVNIYFALDHMNTEFVSIDMCPGKLMYWPSNFVHGISEKISNVTRRSFSFNLEDLKNKNS
jgi:hypothetical protein